MNEHELAEQHRLDERSVYVAICLERVVACLPIIVLVAAMVLAVRVWS